MKHTIRHLFLKGKELQGILYGAKWPLKTEKIKLNNSRLPFSRLVFDFSKSFSFKKFRNLLYC